VCRSTVFSCRRASSMALGRKQLRRSSALLSSVLPRRRRRPAQGPLSDRVRPNWGGPTACKSCGPPRGPGEGSTALKSDIQAVTGMIYSLVFSAATVAGRGSSSKRESSRSRAATCRCR
jgi:hypothetical protein